MRPAPPDRRRDPALPDIQRHSRHDLDPPLKTKTHFFYLLSPVVSYIRQYSTVSVSSIRTMILIQFHGFSKRRTRLKIVCKLKVAKVALCIMYHIRTIKKASKAVWLFTLSALEGSYHREAGFSDSYYSNSASPKMFLNIFV
ncbi:Uncharacterised protein [Bacteroides xylanisolvens]|nr:Uncharacterised protein [Bacteroides xylanisolvens]